MIGLPSRGRAAPSTSPGTSTRMCANQSRARGSVGARPPGRAVAADEGADPPFHRAPEVPRRVRAVPCRSGRSVYFTRMRWVRESGRMDSLDFRSGNLDATEAFLSSAYTPMRIGGPVSDARVRISRRAVGSLSVDRLAFGYDMRYDAGSLGKVCLISMHAGTLVDRTGGRETVFGPGETFLLAQPDLPYQGEVRSARYTIAMFDTVLLDRMAVAGGTAGPGPVRLTAPRATTADGNDRLTAAVVYLRDAVLNDAGSSPGALVVSTAAHHLAAAVLSALPHTART
ncbi:AraC-like ligand-binding domain-containing protein, partial [Kitasatospora sp. NPDC001574]